MTVFELRETRGQPIATPAMIAVARFSPGGDFDAAVGAVMSIDEPLGVGDCRDWGGVRMATRPATLRVARST